MTNRFYTPLASLASLILLIASSGHASMDTRGFSLIKERVDATDIRLPERTAKVKATVLTVDTRDEEACRGVQAQIQDALGNKADLCVPDSERPMVSIFRLEPEDAKFEESYDPVTGRSTYRRSIKPPSDPATRETMRDSAYFGVLGVGVFGIMLALPGEIMNWNENKAELLRNLPRNWRRNVRSTPVLDHDSFAINFIGHPLSGAASYGIARHNGMGILGSFGYSVLMSTFFWEYGVEAMVERPSIQDLIVTPIIGSIMGELFYQADRKITENKGKLLGSRRLGTTARFILNPAVMMKDGLKDLFGERIVNRVHPTFAIEAISDSLFDHASPRDSDPRPAGNYIGFRIGFSWR